MHVGLRRQLIGPATCAFVLAVFWLPISLDVGLLGLTLGAAAAMLLSPETPRSPWPWPDLLVIVFAATAALSALSGHPQVSLALSSPFIPAVLLYLLLSRFVTDPRNLGLSIVGLAIGSTLIALAVLLAAWTQPADPARLIKALMIPVLVVPNDLLLLSVGTPLTLMAAISADTMGWTLVASLTLPACVLTEHRVTPWPHNLFLELLSSQGLVGVVAFTALLGFGVNRPLRTARCRHAPNRLLAVGPLGAFAAFTFAAVVELTFARYWVVIMAATFIGLAAALTAPSAPRAGVMK